MKSMLNEEEGLKHLSNNVELYELVLGEYLKENKETANNLTRAIEEKNFSEAVQIVHKIKSSSASIGAKDLYSVAIDLQKSLESRDIAEIKNLHNEFNRMLIQLISEIEKR
jgi:HPt (histidine-containing phosphotransfer) domain-containing protein